MFSSLPTVDPILNQSMRPQNLSKPLFLALIFSLTGCFSPSQTIQPAPGAIPTIAASPTNTPLTPTQETRAQPTPTRLPAPSSTSPAPFQICSPLQDIRLDELPEIESNPYQSARPGLDDGHPAVDFGFYRHGGHTTMRGLGVFSLLAGQVASVTLDRPPFGNMLIVRTALDTLPAAVQKLFPSFPSPTPDPSNIRLSCPDLAIPLEWDLEHPAVYVLYAHLNRSPLVKTGQDVSCGQPLGEVGTTGNSVNEHLHLEIRLGPGDVTWQSMSHYTPSAAPAEIAAYCQWRVSAHFQPVNPLDFITAAQR